MFDKEELAFLQKTINYTFSNIILLKHALTHRSVHRDNNERLEFLGDAVLNLIMAEVLYCRYSDLSEGDLSRVRSGLVNQDILAKMARLLNLGQYIKLGHGEIKSGGQERDSILADAVEALIGAIYLDGGLDNARQFILSFFDGQKLDELKTVSLKKDPKSALQERLQALRLPLPTYTVETTGKSHEQIFYVTCSVEGLPYTTTSDSDSRRRAEQLAAEKYLQLLESK